MKLSRRTQLLFLAVATLIVAIASMAWWLRASPQSARFIAEAMVILVTGVCALSHCKRVEGSPLVLGTTLAGLAMAILIFWR